jgi:phospholipid/cholesterol/gamma-HCH transport system substrate-binding protein
MRRLATAGLLALAAIAVAVLPGSRADGGDAYRVDVVFDTAKGIVPGQLVKIAGARVGEVRDVTLTGDYRARIHLEVERRFAPFRSDATCSIQPEGLLAENFVQCDPGTPRGRVLRGAGGHAPTVPVQRTSTPVSLNDLFDIWNVPTRERLSILVNELGIGVAGRGEDLNEVLRRANPSLTQARRALTLVNRQRAQLAGAIASTDRVVAALAGRRERVQAFVEAGARVSARTASRSGPLGESIRRLPALLRAARPALASLDALAASGTPLLRDLRTAAPAVNRLVAGLEPFARAGLPAIRGLEPALRTTHRAVRAFRPVTRETRRFTTAARPLAPTVSGLFVDVRDRGFVENALKFVYYAAAAGARFDRTSHILPAQAIFNPCARYTHEPVAGCSSNYGRAASAPAARARRPRAPRRPGRVAVPGAPAPVAPAPPAPSPRGPAAPRPAPTIEGLLDDVVRSITGPTEAERGLEDLAGYLLR